jgi:hypothetical protein
LTVSTRECTPSLNIEELPVTKAARNFVNATARFPANADITTFLELREDGIRCTRAGLDVWDGSTKDAFSAISPALLQVYAEIS